MISINARGLTDKVKRTATFDKYRKLTDVLVILESHSDSKIEQIWRSEWGGNIYFSHGASNSRGVAVCISKTFAKCVYNIEIVQDGRSLIFDLVENGEKVSIATIYAPNEDNTPFFVELGHQLKERESNKIIVGDFNLVLNVELDRLNTYCNNNRAKSEVENLMD